MAASSRTINLRCTIDAAITLHGTSGPQRGWHYTLGVDIGLVHDCTALALVGRHVGYSEPIVSRRTKPMGTWAVLQDLELVPAVDSDVVEFRRIPGTDRLKLCRLEVWQPKDERVDLSAVETRIAELAIAKQASSSGPPRVSTSSSAQTLNSAPSRRSTEAPMPRRSSSTTSSRPGTK